MSKSEPEKHPEQPPEQVQAMAFLADGWDGEEAPAPNSLSRTIASTVLQRLEEKSFAGPVQVHAAVDGGVVIVVRRAGRRASFVVDNDGNVVAGGSDSTGLPWSVVYDDEKQIPEAVEWVLGCLER